VRKRYRTRCARSSRNLIFLLLRRRCCQTLLAHLLLPQRFFLFLPHLFLPHLFFLREKKEKTKNMAGKEENLAGQKEKQEAQKNQEAQG
jgi:hypothetical protein